MSSLFHWLYLYLVFLTSLSYSLTFKESSIKLPKALYGHISFIDTNSVLHVIGGYYKDFDNETFSPSNFIFTYNRKTNTTNTTLIESLPDWQYYHSLYFDIYMNITFNRDQFYNPLSISCIKSNRCFTKFGDQMFMFITNDLETNLFVYKYNMSSKSFLLNANHKTYNFTEIECEEFYTGTLLNSISIFDTKMFRMELANDPFMGGYQAVFVQIHSLSSNLSVDATIWDDNGKHISTLQELDEDHWGAFIGNIGGVYYIILSISVNIPSYVSYVNTISNTTFFNVSFHCNDPGSSPFFTHEPTKEPTIAPTYIDYSNYNYIYSLSSNSKFTNYKLHKVQYQLNGCIVSISDRYNNKIYSFGNTLGRYNGWIYDVIDDSFNLEIFDFEKGRSLIGCNIDINQRFIYLFGGIYFNNAELNTINKWDIYNNTWYILNNTMKYKRSKFNVFVTLKNYFIIIGGTNIESNKYVEIFDSSVDKLVIAHAVPISIEIMSVDRDEIFIYF